MHFSERIVKEHFVFDSSKLQDSIRAENSILKRINSSPYWKYKKNFTFSYDAEIIEQFKKKLRGYFKNFDLINDILHYTITYTSKFEKNGDDESRLRPCPLVFNEVYIDADCRLALCCKDYFKEFDFGSLLKNDFKELYFSKPMEEIRLMHQNIAFPKDHTCRKCLLFSPKEIDD